MPATIPEIERLWTELWNHFFNVDDRYWAKQAPRLREISRLAQALASACTELCSKEDESG